MAGSLIISRDGNRCGIILSGRVNFETVVPLRDFVNHIPEGINELTVELGNCVSMDSTCMGVLSMLALLGIKSKLKMCVLNAGGNRQLLKGLGVEKLFKFEVG
jgi:ABC-type transporter Mla MlaB component